MYTTPRKVKQESRLRRSLSLTNTSRLNGGVGGGNGGNAPSSSYTSTTVNGEKDDYSSGEYHRHLHDIEESRDTNTYFQFNGDFIQQQQQQRSRYSYTPGDSVTLEPIPDLVDSTGDNSIQVHSNSYQQQHYPPSNRNSGHKPPPYRVPPPGDIVFEHQSEDSLIAVTSSDPQHQGVVVPDSPISPISFDSLQIHSSKFPIVQEVVISQQEPTSSSNNTTSTSVNYESNQQQHHHYSESRIPVPVLSPEYIKKFQNKKLTKKKQIAWTDERKAFTLDSQTAKDIQQRLANCPITRANSADLGKAIQSFNEEHSYLMASMQQQQHQQGGRHMDGGIDNPALDLGPHSGSNGHIHNSVGPSAYSSGGNKMSSGFNYSDSSASQSLSLSSSRESSSTNTDSLDTVIYKGPSQSTTSIRDWQRSMESNGDLSHRNDTNSYRDSSGLFDRRSSYQMQQASSYQPMQFNGPGGTSSNNNNNNNNASGSGGTNTYAMEYRHSQQQHQVQQNLSVHSIPSSSTGNNGGNISTLGATPAFSNNNNMRSGNGTAYGSNPQLPTKSPMLSHKQFSTASGQHQTDNRVNPNNSSSSEPMLIDKSKDSTKLFPTKTYNHIKDMISSRFGNGSGGGGVSTTTKGLNNAVHPVVNGVSGAGSGSVSNNNNNNHLATNVNGHNGGNMSSNPSNSYIDLTMGVPASYPHAHNNNTTNGHHHGNSNGNVPMNGHLQSSYNSNGVLPNRNTQHNGPSYYPQSLPSSNNPNPSAVGMVNGNIADSYRSPTMNDRKNVNTSFRKAIQQSTLKSNLTEDSLQLRPIMESASQQNYNNNSRGMQQQYTSISGTANGNKMPSSSNHQQQQYDHETGVQERAQRALDKLMEGSIPLQRNGSGPMTNNSNPTVYTRIQQFSPSAGTYPDDSHFIPKSPQNIQNHSAGATSYAHDKIRYQMDHNNPSALRVTYNVKPGPTSSNSNSSSGLAVIESSLSSPGSYSGNRIPGNHNNNTNEEIHSQQQLSHNQNSKWGHLHDSPPPLPTSQKPDSITVGSINTIGLPSVIPAETRENGDGSSATMETTAGNILLESSSTLCSKSKSDQLKQITTDLQNIALSVAAEHHMHNNNNHHHSSSSECEKGPQRVGSGQSHTTTDSGLGTVMLTKSPLNSNSDPSEHSSRPTDGRPNADSVSSGNDSEWVDLVEPEIQNILEIERASKSGKLNPRNPSVLNPGVNNGITGATTSTPAAVSKNIQQQGGGSSNNINPNGNNSTNLNSNNNTKPQGGNGGISMGDITASPIPHPHTRPSHSPAPSPKLPKKFDLNNYNKKGNRSQSQELLAVPSTSQGAGGAVSKIKSPRVAAKVARSNSGSGQRWSNRQQRMVDKTPKAGGSRQKDLNQTLKGAKLTRNAMSKLGQILYSLQDETGDMTSTTGIDFESALDGHTEFTTDDDDLSTTIDTTDAHAIRRQLESLESMYTEVLKVLGEKKFSNRNRYPPNTAELRAAKRRPYGSMSSLPSSVSSRPFRERSKKVDEKKKVKDLKSINRRFQRLESHVVTLARSVAHLSSEMRTQHLMVQEMESIRNELQQLRNQVVKNTMHNQSTAAAAAQNFNRAASGRHGAIPCANQTDWTSFRNALPSLTNPCRVRKLTKFFGDEPPLIRIFLKKLGYEKYAPAFEQERIGIMELPYLTEERLNKMGIPMGPRLRILQEAQMCLKPGYHGQHDHGHHSHHPNNHTTGNLSVYVV